MPTPRVVVSLLSEDHEFPRMQAADARRAATGAGLQPEVVFADWNPVLQIQQLFKFIHAAEGERPVAIVVETVTGEGLERVARSAVRAGIGWIVLNRRVGYIEELRREHPALPIAMVGVDQRAIGLIQAHQVQALLPGGGTVLYLQGPADTSAARERLEALSASLATGGFDLRVLNGDWSEASAEKCVTGWLRLKTTESARVNLVASQNDTMAVGARKVILAQRKEWSQIPFLGCDGLPEGGQKLVDDRQLTATIVNPTTAGPAVELVARCFGKQAQAADLVLLPRSYPPESELTRAHPRP